MNTIIAEYKKVNQTTSFVNPACNPDELMDILEFASEITNTPCAIISFFDKEISFTKPGECMAEHGIVQNTSIYKHIMQQKELLMISDTWTDKKFKDEFVSNYRFFAGIPLITKKGNKIGVICVFHRQPYLLSKNQQKVLTMLASQIIRVIELRAGFKTLEKKYGELEKEKKANSEANMRLRSFFENSKNLHVLLGMKGDVIDFNNTASSFITTVYQTEIKVGDRFVKYLNEEFAGTFIEKFNLALKGEKSIVEGSSYYGEVGLIWWEAFFESTRDINNNIIGVSYLVRNITSRKVKEKKLLEQNTSLLKIAHIQSHELRSPLATMIGLVNLIKEENACIPSEYINYLEQTTQKIDSTIKLILGDIDRHFV